MARTEKQDIWEKCQGHKRAGAIVEQRDEGKSPMATGGYVCKACKKVSKIEGSSAVGDLGQKDSCHGSDF